MNSIDWLVLFGTIALLVVYGVWKSRGSTTISGYLLGNKSMPWWSVGLGIMATQASAVTFLSTPGQAYEDGMRFLQFYFGLPLAMIILSITAVPLYHKLKVFTAYEYLEARFDLKVRTLAAFFFLLLRGLSVGITVYAPSLILSTILGWNITVTTIFIGVVVAIYTVSGGTKAVAATQKYQLTIIMIGMILAGGVALSKLPPSVSFADTFSIAGELGKLNLINLTFDLTDRYNIWSGLIGGLFLFLSYFGADQSQVGRYLGAKSIAQSRLGLLFNGLLKIPMQFIILYIGILVFVFYQFNQPPLFHNVTLRDKAMRTNQAATIAELESHYQLTFQHKRAHATALTEAIHATDAHRIEQEKQAMGDIQKTEAGLRAQMKETLAVALPGANTLDKDYVFINFVMTYLPHGLVGLLLAVVFLAAMSSTASELNSLASTSVVDIYKRSINTSGSELHYVAASKWFTVGWVLIAMAFAMVANQAENLIQFVNIIGSLFYGTLLGIFLTAFYLPFIKPNAVFMAAIMAEACILYCYFFTNIAFLLYNIIGCLTVVVVATTVQLFINSTRTR